MFDRQFVFFPSKEITGTPADVGLHFEDVYFRAEDGTRLHGWFVPGRSDDTLVWFHGNAANISNRVYNILLLNRNLGLNVFIFDYRGYGRSEGKPSEKGMYMDAEGALEYLRSRDDIDTEKLILFGRSLGGAVAVDLATRHRTGNYVRGVIMESSFTSVKAMSRYMRPAFAFFLPTHLLVKSRFDSLSKIGRIQSPVMIVHGDRDDTVPIHMGRELFDAANEPKRFYTVKGASHDDTPIVGGKAYFAALREFIDNPSLSGHSRLQ